MKKNLISLLFAAQLTTPAAAIGPEECELSGKLGGKTVTLQSIDAIVPAYGSSQNLKYAYCGMKDGNEFMHCALAKGEKPTVIYRVSFGKTDRGIEQRYDCISGCNVGVVKTFVMECNGD